MNGDCSTCGCDIPNGRQFIVGIPTDGRIEFRFACEHKPAPNATVRLCADDCAMEWAAENKHYAIAHLCRSQAAC